MLLVPLSVCDEQMSKALGVEHWPVILMTAEVQGILLRDFCCFIYPFSAVKRSYVF